MHRFDRLWPPASLLRTGLGLALGLGLGASCNLNPVSVFTCLEDQNCIDEAGMGAICEPNNLCTVPDMACPSGKRWHDRAAELAGKCYEDSDLSSTSGAGTAGSGSDTGTGGGSTAGPLTSTTTPVGSSDGDPDSSGDPPPMTDDGGSSSSGGMAGSCDDLFGMVPGYMLCDEQPDSCKFNAMTAGGSCADLCMMYGSTCITSFTNDMGDCASEMLEVACTEVANDNICVCEK